MTETTTGTPSARRMMNIMEQTMVMKTWRRTAPTTAKVKVSSAADVMCVAANGTWPLFAQYPDKAGDQKELAATTARASPMASSERARRAKAKLVENGDPLTKEDMENALANTQRYFSGHARERKENQMRRAKEGLAAASGNFLQH